MLDYINTHAGIDLTRVFAQYLTTTNIPEFQYRAEGNKLSYRWGNVVQGFDMKVRVNIPGVGTRLLSPTDQWQTLAVPSADAVNLAVDENFYVTQRNVGAPPPGAP